MSVGEILALGVWLASMVSHVWQATHHYVNELDEWTAPCEDDPDSQCWAYDGTPAPKRDEWRYVPYYINRGRRCHSYCQVSSGTAL